MLSSIGDGCALHLWLCKGQIALVSGMGDSWEELNIREENAMEWARLACRGLNIRGTPWKGGAS